MAEVTTQIPDPDRELAETGSSDRDLVIHRAMELIRGEFEDDTWQVFVQTVYDGLEAPIVAEELGKTPAAVRKAKARVLRRLREELDGLLD